MRCEKYKKSSDADRISDEMKKHLDECESCRNEYQLDQSLDKLIDSAGEDMSSNPIPIPCLRIKIPESSFPFQFIKFIL